MTIKEARRRKSFSQLELAEKLNVTQGAVSQWENEMASPRTALLPKLAEVLECTVDELLQE